MWEKHVLAGDSQLHRSPPVLFSGIILTIPTSWFHAGLMRGWQHQPTVKRVMRGDCLRLIPYCFSQRMEGLCASLWAENRRIAGTLPRYGLRTGYERHAGLCTPWSIAWWAMYTLRYSMVGIVPRGVWEACWAMYPGCMGGMLGYVHQGIYTRVYLSIPPRVYTPGYTYLQYTSLGTPCTYGSLHCCTGPARHGCGVRCWGPGL